MRVKEYLLDLDGTLCVGDESVEDAARPWPSGSWSVSEGWAHPVSRAQEIVN